MRELKRKPRILFSRYTLDGHDRGLLTVMHRCRNAGMEVIYIHFNDVQEITQTAVQEDVDVIGVTCSMGQHFSVMTELLRLLRENNYGIPVIMGGVIPTVDVLRLLEMGVKGVFGPGSSPEEAVKAISEFVGKEI